jgi:2-phospho-L-lactate guanylyltransferase
VTSWAVLVPQKSFSRAKSRLDLPADQRRILARAMLRDTLETLAETPTVTSTTVLWDEAADASEFPHVAGVLTTGRALNAAIGGAHELAHPGETGLAVVPGDLPALTAAELTTCLERAARAPRAFVPDARDTGTTVVTAAPGQRLVTRYGALSAHAHAAAGLVPIDPLGIDGARADVDDLEALGRALGLGCGHHTLAACSRLRLMIETIS